MSSTAVASAAFLAAAVAGTAIVALIDAKRREATAKLRAGAAPVASDGSGASGAAAGAGAGAGAGSSGALKPWDKPNKVGAGEGIVSMPMCVWCVWCSACV